jgi:phage shock protein PspC (stress-responsive transcriptional regulator)
MMTTTTQPSLFARSDTLFGVCEGIGQDFGFNPDFLRVALAVAVVFNPQLAFGAYILLAAAVLLTRLVFPNPRRKTVAVQPVAAEVPALPVAVAEKAKEPELLMAA